MKKAKITTLLLGILITNISEPVLEPLASEITKSVSEKEQKKENTIEENNNYYFTGSFVKNAISTRNIVENTNAKSKTVIAEQRGDMEAHARNNLKFWFGNNNQFTGVAVKAGQTLIVNVDADENAPMPELVFTQQEGSFSSWRKNIKLKNGKNIITVPKIEKDKNYVNDVTSGGPVYIRNPYTKEQQGKAPVVTFENVQVFPTLNKNTNVDEFKEYLKKYKEMIDKDAEKHPNIEDREIIDVFEFVSEHIIFTGTVTAAYKVYVEENKNPLDTIKTYDETMNEIFRFYGLDKSSEKNDPKFIRENIRLAQPYGYMYAAGDHTGIQRDSIKGLLMSKPGWGIVHEIGHRMDVSAREYGEITNNMLSQHMSGYYGELDNRIPFKKIYENVINENYKFNPGDYFTELGTFWQLELYKPGYWANLNKLYRERDISVSSDKEKMKYLVELLSEALGEDLSEFFEKHGFYVDNETKKTTSKYKKPLAKIWYLTNEKLNFKGEGFGNIVNMKYKYSNVYVGKRVDYYIDKSLEKSVLGYEIRKDGKILTFTKDAAYVDWNADKSKNERYEIIPIDINTKPGSSIVVNSRPDLATNHFIDVNGVNYEGTHQVRAMRINIDYFDKTLYLTDRNSNAIHAGLANKDYFTFTLYDENMNEKASLKMKGSDAGNDSKYNDLNFVKFNIGDYVEVYHYESFRLTVDGQKAKKKKTLYKITENGLEYLDSIDETTINFSGSGKGSFDLVFNNNTLSVENKVDGTFASEYIGFSDYYIQIRLSDKDGKPKAQSNLYGSMYSSNIEIDKLNNVKYEYGDIITIRHIKTSKVRINGDLMEDSEQTYEINKSGLNPIKMPKSIEGTIIHLSGSGKGAFDLIFSNNTLNVRNKINGIFASEYTGFSAYYIQVILSDKNGKPKAQSNLYGSMYSSNIEVDKLNNVKYEYGDIITLTHKDVKYINIQGPVIGGKLYTNTQRYEITKDGLKAIK